MNQDGSSAMPQNPSFSTPNSTDPTPAPITSGPDKPQKSHIFGNRKARLESKRRSDAAAQTAAPTLMSNSPDFFKQAAGINDTVVMLDDAEKPKMSKRPIIIGLIIILLLGGTFAAAMIVIPSITESAQAASDRSDAQKALNRLGNYVISGEEKVDDLPEEKPLLANTIFGSRASIDNYNKIVELSIKTYNAANKVIQDKDDKLFYRADDIKESAGILRALREISELKPDVIVRESEGDSIEERLATFKRNHAIPGVLDSTEIDAIDKYLALTIKRATLYVDNDCINDNGDYDDKLAESKISSQLKELYAAYPDAYTNKGNVSRERAKDILKAIWDIKDRLKANDEK